MRYHQELEDLLRISQEYDNNTKTIHDVLLNLNWEGNWKNNDLTSLGHKLTQLVALCRLRNETIKFFFNCSQIGKVDSKVCKEPSVIPDKTFLANFQEKILTQLRESKIQLDIYSVTIKQLREEVKATLIACGHCDLTDLLPYLEVGNQDQIAALQMMLQWVYPNGKLCCNKNPVGPASSHKIADSQKTPIRSPIYHGIPKSDSPKMVLEVQDTKQNPVPKKNQDTQLNPKQNPMPKKTQDTQLNPKQNPMPKKTMTSRYKFKKIKKGGKVQKFQSPGVHKMNFKPSHRNERIYWSKQLCYVNVNHDSNSFALHNFCHKVTSNINGFHTVTYPENMWLLKRPRVKLNSMILNFKGVDTMVFDPFLT